MRIGTRHPAAGWSRLESSCAGAAPGAGIGKRTLTEGLAAHPLQIGSGDAKQKAAPPKAGGAGPAAHGALGAWAGAGTTGRILQHDTLEAFVDDATGDSVEIQTDWTLAEHAAFELGTSAVMAVERAIRIRLARGVTLLIKSRARAWLDADRLPNDVHAAVHAPARLLKHDGSIVVTDDKGLHLLSAFPYPLAQAQSVAGLLGHEPLLAFETDAAQRLREAERFSAVTVPQHGANVEQIEAILRDAPLAVVGLTRYIRAKLAYESPPAEPLSVGRHLIHRIESLTSGTWTGYEGSAVLAQLQAMWSSFTRLVAHAERVKPADKDGWDHAADAARAIGGAVIGVGAAVKEVALMARDLGLWLSDELASVFGADVKWSASSGIGKAYQSGKSTGEIFVALVDGIVDAWDQALEHAGNGDYSKLMSLGAELALDLAIGAATAGAAAPALAAERAGGAARFAGRALELAEHAAEAIARRARVALAKAQRAAEPVPAAARNAVLDLGDVLQGLLDGLATARHLVEAGTGRTLAVLDPGAIPRAIQHIRGVRAMERAASAMTKLRGPAARAQGERVLARLQALAGRSKMPDAIHAVARRIADGPDKAKLVGALERVLDAWPAQREPEVLARVLRRATDAADPVAFLDDVAWAAARPGLTAEARVGLVRHAVRPKDALDLRWLRELTELPDATLEFMALDAKTQWKDLMRASKRPSDYFPSSLKKVLTPRDYAQAAAKVRGIAGELTFIVDGIELPAGLKIVGRQVSAGTKTIDFALQDARGLRAKLEVKAWSQRTWARALANGAKVERKSRAGRMIEQLQAAKSTGEPVYLAVPDSIGTHFNDLRQLLDEHRLTDVTVVTFPEIKLRSNISKLRVGLGLAGGVALVTADQLAEVEDE